MPSRLSSAVRRRDFLAAALGVAGGIAVWPVFSGRNSRLQVRERPLEFSSYPFQDVEGAIDDSVLDQVRRRLRLRPRMGYGNLLHWLRIFGASKSPEFLAEPSRETLSLVTDDGQIEKRFDQAGVIASTKNGVRILSLRSGINLKAASCPAHANQALAIFGELGLPSSTVLVAADGRFTIADGIRDCLSHLQVREAGRQEAEWATQVLAHYVPPAYAWKNRWGEELTIEQWTEFLVDRDITRFGCSGTHLLHSLGLMLQANARHHVLSSGLTQRVGDVCRQYSGMVEKTQHADGAWRNDWTKQGDFETYDAVEVHVTGHILEAQMYLPGPLRISSSSAARALKYLAGAFLRSNDEEVYSSYCPYSHAGGVLLHCAAART